MKLTDFTSIIFQCSECGREIHFSTVPDKPGFIDDRYTLYVKPCRCMKDIPGKLISTVAVAVRESLEKLEKESAANSIELEEK